MFGRISPVASRTLRFCVSDPNLEGLLLFTEIAQSGDTVAGQITQRGRHWVLADDARPCNHDVHREPFSADNRNDDAALILRREIDLSCMAVARSVRRWRRLNGKVVSLRHF